jgi:hypothetical protein
VVLRGHACDEALRLAQVRGRGRSEQATQLSAGAGILVAFVEAGQRGRDLDLAGGPVELRQRREGGLARPGVEACALCHNPSASNLTGTARLEGATIAVPSVELGFLVHRLHTGDALSAPFVLGASPGPTSSNPLGRPYDARRVRYPGVRGDCATCHLDGTWVVPDAGDRLPSRLETRACVEAPADDADALCAEERWVSASSTVYAPTTRA